MTTGVDHVLRETLHMRMTAVKTVLRTEDHVSSGKIKNDGKTRWDIAPGTSYLSIFFLTVAVRSGKKT